jgi:serine/threonine-protein kinase
MNILHVESIFPYLSNMQLLSDKTGQKVVYRSELDNKNVVLKLIKSDHDTEEEMNREIRAAENSKLSNVPEIIEYGKKSSGKDYFYIIEEYIEGRTLKEEMKYSSIGKELFARRFCIAMLESFIYFEKAHMVHRDIKPDNIIVDLDSKFWIIDFGIVRLLNEESRTPTNLSLGKFTPGYGAPEQFRNEKSKIDIRCDIYSVGIICDEIIRGHNYYKHNSKDMWSLLKKMSNEDIPPLSENHNVSKDFSDFIRIMASRYPSRRPANSRQALEWVKSIK